MKDIKKDKSVIPKGDYCYDSEKLCPYWDKNKTKEDQDNGYCHYLEMGDWDSKGFGLLWDQCKECGENEYTEEELENGYCHYLETCEEERQIDEEIATGDTYGPFDNAEDAIKFLRKTSELKEIPVWKTMKKEGFKFTDKNKCYYIVKDEMCWVCFNKKEKLTYAGIKYLGKQRTPANSTTMFYFCDDCRKKVEELEK